MRRLVTFLGSIVATQNSGQGLGVVATTNPYPVPSPAQRFTMKDEGIFHDGRVNFHELKIESWRKDPFFIRQVKSSVENAHEERGDSSLNLMLGNEGYVGTEAVLREIIDKRLGDAVATEEKQSIGRKILCAKSGGFDYNFLHLLGVPLVQIDGEVIKYRSMMKVAGEFLSSSELSPEEAFSITDSAGNSPLHVIAALAPINQFEAFCEAFGELIPQKMWGEKNANGHSALDILKNPDLHIQYMRSISKALAVDLLASEKSPSDMLHDPVDDLDRAYCTASNTGVPAYPKSLWSHDALLDNYFITDPLSNSLVLDRVPRKDYERVAHLIPDGKTYGEISFEDRGAKLKIARKLTKDLSPAPSSVPVSVKGATALRGGHASSHDQEL